jgi:hypothetical protein
MEIPIPNQDEVLQLDETLTNEVFKYRRLAEEVEVRLLKNRKDLFSATQLYQKISLEFRPELTQLSEIEVVESDKVVQAAERLFFQIFNNMRAITVYSKIELNEQKDLLCYGKRGFSVKRNKSARAILEFNSRERIIKINEIMKRAPDIAADLRTRKGMNDWANRIENFALLASNIFDASSVYHHNNSSDAVTAKLASPIQHIYLNSSSVAAGASIECFDLSELQYKSKHLVLKGKPINRHYPAYGNSEFTEISKAAMNSLHKQAPELFAELIKQRMAQKVLRENVIANLKDAFKVELLAVNL